MQRILWHRPTTTHLAFHGSGVPFVGQALLRMDIDKRITSLCEDAAAQKQVH